MYPGRPEHYIIQRGVEFTLYSPAFQPGGPIPPRYTCDGEDVSPPLVWEGVPPGTQAYALIMYDPDAPAGTFIHWVIYDVPGHRVSLPEAVPPALIVEGVGVQGVNDFGNIGYGGPCPPPGHGPHRYFFALHALSQPLGLEPGVTADELLRAIEPYVIGYAVTMGVYER